MPRSDVQIASITSIANVEGDVRILDVGGTNVYVATRRLGGGADGEVFAGTIVVPDGGRVPCAIKRTPADEGVREGPRAYFAAFYRQPNGELAFHRNVVQVEDSFVREGSLWIVMERCDGTLARWIVQPGFRPQHWFRGIARDVLRGLHQVHHTGGAHAISTRRTSSTPTAQDARHSRSLISAGVDDGLTLRGNQSALSWFSTTCRSPLDC
jgi:hypothetical protein